MNIQSINITKVVVFIPPAVDAGLPPINIRRLVAILLCGVSDAWSKVEKPAVLGVILWKIEFIILSQVLIFPIVFGLFHSSTANNIAPPKIRTEVIIKTNFE